MNVRALLNDIAAINPPTPIRDGGPIPFVDMGSIQPGTRFVRSSTYREKASGARFKSGDTLFARITPCLENGKIAQFQSNADITCCGSTEFIVLRARDGRTDPAFLYYLATSDDIRERAIATMAGASGRQRVTLEAFKEIDVPLPSIDAQRKIAAVLSAYDDLIENNTRRIKLLEEMAQRIYREWFVDFRYPGHEAVPLVESELGLIPEGWQWKFASEAISINPKVAVARDVSHPFVPMTSLSEMGMHIEPLESRVGTSGAKFQNGDTLFARITPCLENGKTAFVQCLAESEVATGSTEFIVLRSSLLSPELVYLLARNDAFRGHAMKSMSGATGRQRVREECFERFPIPMPAGDLIQIITDHIRPMFHFSFRLFLANRNLRSTRDLLLPRLISGEIDVSDLDIAVQQVAV